MTTIQRVHINGDKAQFNSKNAVERFKAQVKAGEFDCEVLTTKYLSQGNKFELESKTDEECKFKIVPVKAQDANKEKRDILKARLNIMKNNRTNSDVHKAKQSNVPEEILQEYLKLKKVVKMPIPEPSEILSKPEEYKPIVSMVLNNQMMNQFGKSHPYVRYFTLLAEKLGVEKALPVATHDHLSAPVEKVAVKGNTINHGDYETDSDTEEEKE